MSVSKTHTVLVVASTDATEFLIALAGSNALSRLTLAELDQLTALIADSELVARGSAIATIAPIREQWLGKQKITPLDSIGQVDLNHREFVAILALDQVQATLFDIAAMSNQRKSFGW